MKELTAEQIKNIRLKYGLTQQSFATVLGLGVASIVRYEGGVKPSKANANLIRAAEDPRFMQGCLERDGASIPAAQRKKAEEVTYAYITLEPKGEAMDEMSRIYEFTLQQEVLTERIANMIATMIRWQVEDELSGGKGNGFEGLIVKLSKLKPTVIQCENGDWKYLERISGYLDCVDDVLGQKFDGREMRDAA